MNLSQSFANICNLLKARAKSRVQGVIGFGLASYGLKTDARFF